MVALNPPTLPSPNLSETIEFLSWLPSPAPNIDTEVICVLLKSPTFQARSLPISAVNEALQTIQGTHNCYFQVNAGPKDKKAEKLEITHVRMLHVDLDNPDGLQLLKDCPIAPSVTIFSGGGYQAFWFFKDAYAVNRPSDVQAFEDLNQRIAQYLHADHCWNIDRVMRLPGTINVPNSTAKIKAGRTPALAYIVRDPLLTDPARFHDPRVFTELPTVVSTHSQSTNDQAVVPLKLSNLTENLRDPIPQEIRELIEFGDTQAHFPSRSEAVFRVVLGLHRVNLAEHVQVALLLHKDNAISESILERADPLKEAWRQVHRGRDVLTTSWPEVTKKTIKSYSYANNLVALRRLGIEGFRDDFREKYFLQDENGRFTGELSDVIATQLRRTILREFNFDPGKQPLQDALEAICSENIIHSIRDAFPRILKQWDEKPRLKHLFWWYFGADKTELNEQISEIILVAAIRRIRFPGIKFDTIPVLEGPQGSNKSTALAILAGKANFSDQDLLTMDTKTQAEAIVGIWIYELSELSGLHKADADKVKAFASRDTDRVRPAFGHYRIDRGRQVIFIGTTNEDTYLRDTTGNRRFWPIKTTLIRLDDLIRDRLQLIAEAIHLEAQGRSIVLEERLWAAAAAIQHSRLVQDSWVEELRTLGCYFQNGSLRVSSQDVLAHLQRTPDKQGIGDFRRAADAMRTLKWDGPKVLLINGELVRGYEAPNDGTVPHMLIPNDPQEDERAGRPHYLRVVDDNFTVDGKPVDPKKIH